MCTSAESSNTFEVKCGMSSSGDDHPPHYIFLMTFLTTDKIALSISFKHHSQGGGTWSSLCDGSAILDCVVTVVWFEEIR